MKIHKLSPMQWLAILFIAFIATACASMGRPEGGPRDKMPPVFISSNPKVGALNVSRQVLDLYFDENVQLQDAFNKVIVSPVQKNTPRVNANGRHVRVELQDSLMPNTTYTIDFADAIKDLNEGNILDGFATYFSTGDSIDSLSISGMVLEARTLEPAQGMLVGVYRNAADSSIRTTKFDRIARTNQYGQFSVLNLKPGDYRIYAVKDDDRNFFWGPSEDVAFYDVTISPRVESIQVTDTLRSSNDRDSLVSRDGWAYYPNDVLLTWFNENNLKPYIKDYKRDGQRKVKIEMGTPTDSLPIITIAKGAMEGRDISDWAKLQANTTLDTLTYWISDTVVLNTDSLYLSVKYRSYVDSLKQLSWKTDTLKFFYDRPKKKKSKKEEEADTLPPEKVFVNLKAVTGQNHEVYMPLIMSLDQPIDTIIQSGVHLELAQDTLWLPVKDFVIESDSLNPLLNWHISHKWKPGEKYRLTVDSASVHGIYNEHNKEMKHEFTVKSLEEYSNVIFNVSPASADVHMVAEILDKADKVIRVAPVVNGRAEFKYLNPGTVYARLFIDANANGKWDTGILDSIQPEEVYYYPKKINLKKNWDVSLDWNIYELPVDKQKPYDILKNRPKLKQGERAPVDEEEEDEEDFDMFGGYNNPYDNNRRNSRNNNRNGRNNTGRSNNSFGGVPGLRGNF